MLKATTAQAPFEVVYGDRIEWNGIYPMMVKESDGSIQKTLIDPRTVQEVYDDECDLQS